MARIIQKRYSDTNRRLWPPVSTNSGDLWTSLFRNFGVSRPYPGWSDYFGMEEPVQVNSLDSIGNVLPVCASRMILPEQLLFVAGGMVEYVEMGWSELIGSLAVVDSWIAR